jgi:cobalt ECF transporter T component CbiQ
VAFLEKTLRGASAVLKDSVAGDRIALRDGFLQRFDPRAKLAGTVILVVSAVVARDPRAIAGVWLLALAFAALSRVGVPRFLARTVPVVPLFTLLVALPAAFSLVTPGETVATVALGSATVSLTRQGIASAGTLALRALAAVSLASLLTLTTAKTALLAALRDLRVPAIFVMTAGMTLRYVYLLLECAERSFLAVKSRVGVVRKGSDGRKTVGWGAGALWLSSYRLQGEVYDAMVSRGFAGEYVPLDRFRARGRDIVLLFVSVLILVGVLWLNRYSR